MQYHNCQAVRQLILQRLIGEYDSLISTPDVKRSDDSLSHECTAAKGGSDGGVFGIVFATSLVLGQCPTYQHYKHKQMQCHLIQCLEMISFPLRKVNQNYIRT